MLTKNSRKQEIEDFLKGKGDFIQIDHLNRFIKLMPPIDLRKFAYLKLARIYLDRAMFIDAAKAFRNAGVNSITFREQQDNYMKEAKSFIRAMKFDSANNAFKKTLSEANQKEREALYKEFLDYFKKVGEDFNSQGLPGKATKIYEKLIRMKLSEEEKEEAKERLLNLYEKLGKTKEYNFLKSI